MKYLVAGIRLIVLVINSFLFCVASWILFLFSFGNTRITLQMVGWWGKTCLFLLNVKVNLSGQLPGNSVIIMPNHRSYIDIFLVLAYSPASIVAKKELGKWPVIGQSVKLARMILVDRTKLSSANLTMQRVANEIKQGGRVILFPEGTTYEGPLTKKFKSGSFKIAWETNTPIVPVAINYADKNDAWVGDELFLPHFYRQMGKWQIHVQIWYGEPIMPMETKSLITKVQTVINARLKALNHK